MPASTFYKSAHTVSPSKKVSVEPNNIIDSASLQKKLDLKIFLTADTRRWPQMIYFLFAPRLAGRIAITPKGAIGALVAYDPGALSMVSYPIARSSASQRISLIMYFRIKETLKQ
jgi:hypothetical protein